jgi:hypothetical protein
MSEKKATQPAPPKTTSGISGYLVARKTERPAAATKTPKQ